MTKLLENIFRSVNIALVNELAMLCDRMKIDVWEVIEAAATKPFGFMKFQPGPGLGGHCIPIDPFYLSWKAREFDFWTEFIELAGKVNENMPYFCVREGPPRSQRARQEPDRSAGAGAGRGLQGRHRRPARVAGPEGHPPAAARTARWWTTTIRTCPSSPSSGSRRSISPTAPTVAGYDAVLIVTAHSGVDYRAVVQQAQLVVDFRNATAGIADAPATCWKLVMGRRTRGGRGLRD